MITDYMLAALAIWCAFRLVVPTGAQPSTSRVLWGSGLAALALSSVAGGTYHGFSAAMGPEAAAALWIATACGVGLMDLLMLSASLTAMLEPRWRRLALCAAGLKFLFFAAWMMRHDAYRYVVYDYLLAWIAILVLHTATTAGRQPASTWILAGLLVSLAAAAVQLLGISPHQQFNHNDLYHVIQMGGVYLLYRGGALLRDRQVARDVRGGRTVRPG